MALNARVVPAGAAGAAGDAPAAAQIGATGTFSTEEAKLNGGAAEAAGGRRRDPGSPAGMTARYHLAGALGRARPPRRSDHGVRRRGARAGATTLYGRMARIGKADAQTHAGQLDAAIATWKD